MKYCALFRSGRLRGGGRFECTVINVFFISLSIDVRSVRAMIVACLRLWTAIEYVESIVNRCYRACATAIAAVEFSINYVNFFDGIGELAIFYRVGNCTRWRGNAILLTEIENSPRRPLRPFESHFFPFSANEHRLDA